MKIKKCECKVYNGMLLIIGLLLLVWAVWWPNLDWRLAVGGFLTFVGIVRMLVSCKCK